MSQEKHPDFITGKVTATEVKAGKSISALLGDMLQTGFQGRTLAQAKNIIVDMLQDPQCTILLGYAGSLSTTGQWKYITYLIENGYIDILVATGANLSEDLVEAMGYSYWQGSPFVDNSKVFKKGYNRYYDVFGKEPDYLEMTELIAEFILTLNEGYNYSSREFLHLFGVWLAGKKKIKSIVSTAAMYEIPIFCPAIADSPYGDAALIAKSKGFALSIDAIKDYTEFMSLGEKVKKTGVIFIGGGVPTDFIQLFSVTAGLMYKNREVPNRTGSHSREGTNETYYPHEYCVKITTDSPQWGGLSGCTPEEAITWGKEKEKGKNVMTHVDATIALPLITHGIAEAKIIRLPRRLTRVFNR